MIELPTFAECVIGYRQWVIDPLGRLQPLTLTGHPWHPGINTAQCLIDAFEEKTRFHGAPARPFVEQHGAPAPQCHCGIYAYHRLHSALPPPAATYPADDEIVNGIPVAGAIAALGHIEVHHVGFRAERAGVVVIALTPGMGPLTRSRVREVAARYRVACVDLDALEQEASKHGSPLPDAARPPEPVHQSEWRSLNQMRLSMMLPPVAAVTGVSATGAVTVSATPRRPRRRVSRVPIYANVGAAAFNALWFIVDHWWGNVVCGAISGGFAITAARRRRKALAGERRS